ncbi:DNA-binding response regulator [Spongiactinospora gelatinilytica]|uniref:DNA-binding response regulator n=1 Tax=Spongiactinospora gelatinilytica TaxID=2666298 RepID=A0A2W2EP29_9ACTN|nr:response regulator transcription factor [Spongiactinospora gelatinilytica]PZG26022.1 DNA-binding response regulator [Spongiactinospora gelatinilytica]
MIRVVIADDQAMVREGFGALLDRQPDMSVVGHAGDGETAIEVCRRERPDVVLLDVRMPVMDGLQAARALLHAEVPPRVIILTTFDLDDYVFEALRAGASGFLLKDARADDLVQAVRVVVAGEALLAPTVTRRLIERYLFQEPALPPATSSLDALTPREIDVFALLARGLSNAEIAARLTLAEETVKTHVGRILAKLGLRDRVQAVVLAYESGFVSPGRG